MDEIFSTTAFGGDYTLKRVAETLRLNILGWRWRMFGECHRRFADRGEVSLSKKGDGRYSITIRGNGPLAAKEAIRLNSDAQGVVSAAHWAEIAGNTP